MENTDIEWTDHSFNWWEGCAKVSPGCANCYAEQISIRFGKGKYWGKGKPRRKNGPDTLKNPYRWNAGHEKFFAKHGRRQRVFCQSMSDWLDPSVDHEWRAALLETIYETPNLDWLLLSKRPEHFHELLQYAIEAVHHGEEPTGFVNWAADWLNGERCPENVWAGTSAENQHYWDNRVGFLSRIPAKTHFVSAEPLLGPIDMSSLTDPMPDWVIVGGESGPGARPIERDWVTSLRDQCQQFKVAFFFKQWGGVHKKTTGRMLDRRTWEEFPS